VTKTKTLIVCALVACLAAGAYYADLLRAAVTFNPIPYGPESRARRRAQDL